MCVINRCMTVGYWWKILRYTQGSLTASEGSWYQCETCRGQICRGLARVISPVPSLAGWVSKLHGAGKHAWDPPNTERVKSLDGRMQVVWTVEVHRPDAAQWYRYATWQTENLGLNAPVLAEQEDKTENPWPWEVHHWEWRQWVCKFALSSRSQSRRRGWLVAI